MTIPTTPTGGEPTAGKLWPLGAPTREQGLEAYAAKLAARVAELEGMLAVAKKINNELIASLAIASGMLKNMPDVANTAKAVCEALDDFQERVAQLDKEAGGK